MAILKSKPTSPGSRFVIRIQNNDLHKGKPFAQLLDKISKSGGRNNTGRITTRHIGGGHKKFYRIVDFKRNKVDIPAVVERVEYDPNRTANIALVLYRDGERRYIIAPKGIEVGQEILSAESTPVKPGNCMPLRNMPLGTTVHCVELKPGKGAQIARSAGTSVQLVAKDGQKVIVELIKWEDSKSPQGKITKILGDAGDNNAEMNSIMYEYNLPVDFPQEVINESELVPEVITEKEISNRRDMRDVTTITIDPVDAKDFDDAISIKIINENNIEVGVHIADVGHYVKSGTKIDDEAYKRSTSVYLVDRCVPMLPERLSNGICSLKPHEDRLAF